MESKEIEKLHRYLHRHKIVLYVIVGFLALLTYLLIVLANQVSREQAFQYNSQAYEGGWASMQARQMMGDGEINPGRSTSTTSNPDKDKYCFEYEMESGGSFAGMGGPRCSAKIICKKYKDGKTAEDLRIFLQELINRNYGADKNINCSVLPDGSVQCTSCIKTNASGQCTQYAASCPNLVGLINASPISTICDNDSNTYLYCGPKLTATPTPQPPVDNPVLPPAGSEPAPTACPTVLPIVQDTQNDYSGKCAGLGGGNTIVHIQCNLNCRYSQCTVQDSHGACLNRKGFSQSQLEEFCRQCATNNGRAFYTPAGTNP